MTTLSERFGRGARSSSPVVRRPNLRGSILRGRDGGPSEEPPSTAGASGPSNFQLTPELGQSPASPSPPSGSAGAQNTIVGTTEARLRAEAYEDAFNKLRDLGLQEAKKKAEMRQVVPYGSGAKGSDAEEDVDEDLYEHEDEDDALYEQRRLQHAGRTPPPPSSRTPGRAGTTPPPRKRPSPRI